MRILKFQASNIKKLRVVEIVPAGDVVMVTGANDQGKSSVLDSIWYCLGGANALPSTPIRVGATKASIELDLGDIKVKRTFSAAGNTQLIVADAEGRKYPSPQSVLDRLTGALSFDPLAFLNKEPAQQLATLRKLVKLDVDIDALTAENVRDYDARRDLNRDMKAKKAVVESIVVSVDAPSSPIDIDEIQDQIADASDTNARVAEQQRRLTNAADAIASSAQRAAELRRHANEMTAQAALEDNRTEQLRKDFSAMPKVGGAVDTRELSAQLDAALAANASYDAILRHAEASAEYAELEAQADALTTAMEAREEQKRAAIERAKMPVTGLGFGEGEVLYNGLPLSQAAKSIRLRVSTAIAAALNPKLRVILVHDGSLIDPAGMVVLRTFAKEQDMQIWVEAVETSGKVGIVMEDGEVVADCQ